MLTHFPPEILVTNEFEYENDSKLVVFPLLLLNFTSKILKELICQVSLMRAAERGTGSIINDITEEVNSKVKQHFTMILKARKWDS